MNVLAERIRKLREEKKISQTELGKLVNVSKTTISNYETEYSSPDNETLVMLADALNSSTDYLLGRTDRPELIVVNYKDAEIQMNKVAEKKYSDEDLDNLLKFIENIKEKK